MIPRLFVYGTLAPGQVHADQLTPVTGDWQPATFRGRLYPWGWGAAAGYPGLVPDQEAEPISGWVLTSSDLPDHWSRLDAFEGAGYRRVSGVAHDADGRPLSVHLYALIDDPRCQLHDALTRQLLPYQTLLGDDFTAYAHHGHRVLALCQALAPAETATCAAPLVLATVFHDLGLWSHQTLDYLPPSVTLAADRARAEGHPEWIPLITQLIEQHHAVRPVLPPQPSLIETFRKADWVDVSWGAYRAGLPKAWIQQLYQTWPDAGFHAVLMRRTLHWIWRHPLKPLPMMRW